MSLILILGGLASIGWFAFEIGRMSRPDARVQAWDEDGRPLQVDVVS